MVSLATATLPSWEEEVWRYSPIDELDLTGFVPATAGDRTLDGLADMVESLPAHSALVILRDGEVVFSEGTHLVSGDAATALLGTVRGGEVDVFSELNDEYCLGPVVIDVPGGTDVALPIIVINLVETSGLAVFPRLAVRVGADASVNVLDIVRSDDGVDSLVVPVVEYDVAAAARCGYLNVEDLGADTWQIAHQVSNVAQEATFTAGCAAFGGAYARTRVDCRLNGRGSTGNLGAIYFGDGDQTLDFRTFQDHIGPDTTSNLLFKGVLDDSSTAIYTGLIRVGHEARGTNAFQTNRNIKLSEDAWAESVPNLEIETNDVKCSHASTVGPIDEEQRFYLESRGVPTAVAERLIVAGFFDEVFDMLPSDALVPMLRERIAAKLKDQPMGASGE